MPSLLSAEAIERNRKLLQNHLRIRDFAYEQQEPLQGILHPQEVELIRARLESTTSVHKANEAFINAVLSRLKNPEDIKPEELERRLFLILNEAGCGELKCLFVEKPDEKELKNLLAKLQTEAEWKKAIDKCGLKLHLLVVRWIQEHPNFFYEGLVELAGLAAGPVTTPIIVYNAHLEAVAEAAGHDRGSAERINALVDCILEEANIQYTTDKLIAHLKKQSMPKEDLALLSMIEADTKSSSQTEATAETASGLRSLITRWIQTKPDFFHIGLVTKSIIANTNVLVKVLVGTTGQGLDLAHAEALAACILEETNRRQTRDKLIAHLKEERIPKADLDFLSMIEADAKSFSRTEAATTPQAKTEARALPSGAKAAAGSSLQAKPATTSQARTETGPLPSGTKAAAGSPSQAKPATTSRTGFATETASELLRPLITRWIQANPRSFYKPLVSKAIIANTKILSDVIGGPTGQRLDLDLADMETLAACMLVETNRRQTTDKLIAYLKEQAIPEKDLELLSMIEADAKSFSRTEAATTSQARTGPGPLPSKAKAAAGSSSQAKPATTSQAKPGPGPLPPKAKAAAGSSSRAAARAIRAPYFGDPSFRAPYFGDPPFRAPYLGGPPFRTPYSRGPSFGASPSRQAEPVVEREPPQGILIAYQGAEEVRDIGLERAKKLKLFFERSGYPADDVVIASYEEKPSDEKIIPTLEKIISGLHSDPHNYKIIAICPQNGKLNEDLSESQDRGPLKWLAKPGDKKRYSYLRQLAEKKVFLPVDWKDSKPANRIMVLHGECATPVRFDAQKDYPLWAAHGLQKSVGIRSMAPCCDRDTFRAVANRFKPKPKIATPSASSTKKPDQSAFSKFFGEIFSTPKEPPSTPPHVSESVPASLKTKLSRILSSMGDGIEDVRGGDACDAIVKALEIHNAGASKIAAAIDNHRLNPAQVSWCLSEIGKDIPRLASDAKTHLTTLEKDRAKKEEEKQRKREERKAEVAVDELKDYLNDLQVDEDPQEPEGAKAMLAPRL